MTVARHSSRRLWLRSIVAILAIFIGHDAIMAMDVHDAHSGSSDQHHEVIVQGCGAIEGAVTQSSSVPEPHAPAAFISTMEMAQVDVLSWIDTRDGDLFADASTRRAMTQVFLN